MNLKGTHTEENLQQAMMGEALAYIRYQIYASLISKVSKDLAVKIEEIAHNEKEHFKVWAKLLYGEEYYNNESNLISAIVGEVEECENLYPNFARIAREEGFDEIAEKFDMVSTIECHHSWQFEDFLDYINNNKMDGTNQNGFICLNCGYIHKEDTAPDECPVCAHPKEYFKYIEKGD